MRRAVLAAVLLCCGGDKPPPIETGPLPPGVVGRVAQTEIPEDLAVRVARAQHVTPRDATQSLADDALAARVAQDRGLDRDPDVAWRLRAFRARLVSDRLRDEAKAQGPLTDSEIEELTQEHWQDLDSPEQRTVIHAVVRKPASSGDAVPIADAIRRAVEDAQNADEFEQKANAVPHGTIQVKVERLPPFVADGRVAAAGMGGGFDKTFAAATFEISAAGKTSAVVETSFGWHVIRLLEITPPHHVPIEQRRLMLAAEGIARRAKTRQEEILAAQRSKNPVEISLSAEQSMKAVTHGKP